MLIRAPDAVLLRRSVTPDSRSRLPNISSPSNGAADGMNRQASTQVITGNRITAVFDTGLAWRTSMWRSSLVVSRRRIGGKITGTSAM